MAKYMIMSGCSYGSAGEIIEINDDLTDRQKVMLTPYKGPIVKVDESEDIKMLKAENEALKAELEAIKAAPELKLEAATPRKTSK